MAESNDVSREDRTLPASARRLQQARDDGDLARSRELGHAAVLGAAFAGCLLLGPSLSDHALRIVRSGMTISRQAAFEPQRALEAAVDLAGQAFLATLPMVALLAVAAVAGTLAMGGLVLTTKPLMPNFSRLNPIAGFSRILSRDGAIELGKLLVLAGALIGLATWFTIDRLPLMLSLAALPLAQGASLSWEILRDGLGLLVLLLAGAALLDAPLTWFRHHAKLRMTPEEARKEAKETEGDPHVKARIRARQREMSRSRMLQAVPTADVVVTNPTHYAVALRYDEASMAAPRVVAKGADLLAATIRDAARDAGVPLLEAPPLARALYTHAEVDRDIPVALYTAVAQVLAYVYQLRHFVPGRTPAPAAPASIEVPAGLDPASEADAAEGADAEGDAPAASPAANDGSRA